MKIFVLWERRNPPVPSPIMVEAVSGLVSRGHQVELARCDQLAVPVDRLVPAHDLYVLKSHTPFALSVAAALHLQGARWVNPYPACALVADKARTARLLEAGGVPVPRTWAVGDLEAVRGLVGPRPLVVKPARGLHGAGVRIVRRQSDLDDVPPLTEPAVVQELVPGTGVDLKLYVAGDEVFGTRKAFAPDSYARPGSRARVDDELRRLALRVGEVTGLGLYGLDVIESPDGPFVVDVNYFPGYRGHAGAGVAVAGYLDDVATGRRSPRLPAPAPAVAPEPLRGEDSGSWLQAAAGVARMFTDDRLVIAPAS